jgi:hypothetical protein
MPTVRVLDYKRIRLAVRFAEGGDSRVVGGLRIPYHMQSIEDRDVLLVRDSAWGDIV